MQGFLTGLLENNTISFISAFLLGLLTAISPCPMATNITAIGFIGKDIENRKRVFYNGVVYTAGRAVSYVMIAFVLFLGADQFEISGIFQRYGEKIIGPLLIVIGLFMLGVLSIGFPGFGKLTQKFQEKGIKNYWDVLVLGILFALAFCPYSGVLYFGLLIPMSISSVSGLFLPLIFAVATGIPVIIIAWLVAFAISQVGSFYTSLKKIEFWMRRGIAVLFIGVGIYYIGIIYFDL